MIPLVQRGAILGVMAVAPAFTWAHGAAEAQGESGVSFQRQILPVLQAECQACHQPAKAKGGYVLTDFTRLTQPGDEGKPPVVPGNPADSYLLQQVTPRDGKASMPKGQPPLDPVEIELLRRWIAAGAHDDTPARSSRVYDAAHPPTYSRPPVIVSLDYSPDGAWLAVAGFHEVLLHRGDGSGLAARLVGVSERIQSVRFSPDGRRLAVAGGQPARLGEVQIWNVEQRKLEVSVAVGSDTVYGVNWSPDGTLVSFGCPDKTVRAIDAATGKQVLQQMAHEDWVLDTVFSTNGSHVISVGRDMTAKLTEVPTQRFVDNITSITPGALRGGLQSVARHPFRDEILVGGSDGRPQVFQVFRQAARKIGDNAALLRRFPGWAGRIFSVDYSPDGKRIAAGATLDAKGAVNLYAAEFDPSIPAALLKAYEKTSGEYTAEEREAIERFTTADIKLLHQLEVPEAGVYAVAFSPGGQRLAVGTGVGTVLLVNVETGDVEKTFAAAPLQTELASDPPRATERAADSASATVEPEATEPLPPVVKLETYPDQIQLASRNEHVQLVVMASLLNGDVVDATRRATYTLDTEIGLVSPAGRFTGMRPGQGTLRVSVAGQSVTLPVDLSGLPTEFDGDFIRDVNPVLSRLGCNAGTCHGSKEGKNGFKLSLRGYDPLFDVRSLTDDLASRRVNVAAPDESLMLLKATGAVPHVGGQRTPHDSEYYAVLRQWIAEGARLETASPRVARLEITPSDPIVQAVGSRQQFRVVATYTDGRTRDVTHEAFLESGNTDVAIAEAKALVRTLRRGEAAMLARYEGAYAATTVTVMGERDGFVWEEPPANNRMDELVAAKWRRLRILPSGLCTDAEFIRRVSLDLTGLPPTAEEVREFLANPRDTRSKRDALIERLLGSDAFLDHWTAKWADLLQVNRKFLGEEGARLFRDWIRAELSVNRPYDEFVRRILAAAGSNRETPAASYWKILRSPTDAMENTTHLFLATRFNCNKCHDHPFERWTQDQYYELSQYFAQVSLTKDEASGDRRIGGTAVEDARPLFEIVGDRSEGGVTHERTGQIVAPAFPFPTGDPAAGGPAATRRQALAAWLTSPGNRYFASSYVNRLWGYLLGVGLIEPLDDIRAGNPPSNPELLDHLTREFVESGFNTRHILRQICQSRTYQLELATHRWNADDQVNYSHALPRRLPAEVLFDAVYRVTGATSEFPGAPPGTRASQLVDSAVDVPSGFLANLGRPPRESACECERSNDLKLSSVMALLSGTAVSQAINQPTNALAGLVAAETDDRKLANEVFLRVLNRPARECELDLVASGGLALKEEHTRQVETLARVEAAWVERRRILEHERTVAMTRAEQALADHLLRRAPELAAAQRERGVRIAVAEAAVNEQESTLGARLAAWETQLEKARFETAWTPLDPTEVRGAGSAQLRKLADGSVRSIASIGELPTYTVVAPSTLTNITGVKLEALPDAELPSYGPGHKDGDFLITEFQVEFASRTNASNFKRAKIVEAATDRIADGLKLDQLYNGITEQGRFEGWGLGGGTGRPHWATFRLEAPISDTNGVVLRFTLHHSCEAPSEIGRFRLWVTTQADPRNEGLPAGLGGVLKTPLPGRNPAQNDQLRRHYRALDPELLRHDFQLVLAQKPLPEDERQKELEQELARACRPVPTDPALAQLRQDVEVSARQLERQRLTAVQDLAWALINTPSFLFNH